VRGDLSNQARDVYVAGIGSHSPGEPIPFEQIEDVLGPITGVSPKLSKWIDRMRPIMREMLSVKYCHYALDPETRKPTEDNVTMSVASARRALAMAGLKATDVDLLVYGGNIMEYTCPPTSTLIQEALEIPACAAYAIHSNCTSIYKALQLAADQIRLGRYNTALLTTAQLSSPFLRAEHFNPKVVGKSDILLRWFLCDGAGALVLTADPNVGQKRLRVLGTYNESMGLGLGPDMYCKAGGSRVNPLEVYEQGWHHLSQNFDRVASLSVELGRKAADRMMERLGMDWQELRYVFLNVPTRHIYDQVEAEVRVTSKNPRLQFYSELADRGYPGACAIIHALDGFLHDTPLDKGDILASVVAESSKWMFGGFALEYVG